MDFMRALFQMIRYIRAITMNHLTKRILWLQTPNSLIQFIACLSDKLNYYYLINGSIWSIANWSSTNNAWFLIETKKLVKIIQLLLITFFKHASLFISHEITSITNVNFIDLIYIPLIHKITKYLSFFFTYILCFYCHFIWPV